MISCHAQVTKYYANLSMCRHINSVNYFNTAAQYSKIEAHYN